MTTRKKAGQHQPPAAAEKPAEEAEPESGLYSSRRAECAARRQARLESEARPSRDALASQASLTGPPRRRRLASTGVPAKPASGPARNPLLQPIAATAKPASSAGNRPAGSATSASGRCAAFVDSWTKFCQRSRRPLPAIRWTICWPGPRSKGPAAK